MIRLTLTACTALLTLVLSGCSTLGGSGFFSGSGLDEITPETGEPVLKLSAEGNQIFRCMEDARGPYWHFEQPQANLFNEEGERLVRHSGPMFAFDHVDGSRIIASRVVKWVKSDNPAKNIPSVLMSAVTEPGEGTLDSVTFVQRIHTEGGMPQKDCVSENVGHLLKVPYKSEYIFWKPIP